MMTKETLSKVKGEIIKKKVGGEKRKQKGVAQVV